MASALPILPDVSTSLPRFTLPILRLFNLDGFGSLSIHSETDEPDCNNTFAILGISDVISMHSLQNPKSGYPRFQGRCVFVRPVCDRYTLPSRTTCSPDTVDITLHTLRPVIINDSFDSFEVHSSRNNLGAYQDPALPC